MIRRLLLTTIGIAAMAGPVRATPATPPPEFEVASVKPRPFAPGAMMVKYGHGTLHVDTAALRQIVGLAYGIQRVRVQGGPSWLDTEQYVIAAKAESADATPKQVLAMLQTLLADRFKLAVHHETKELDIHSLSVGKNGAKLQEAKEEEKTNTIPGRG